MATTFSTTTTNPHITALESAFSDATKPIEWLIIAHNDAKMLQSLCFALADESAAVLELSQETWDFEGKHLPETVEWALQQGEIKNLVIAGNSEARGAESRATLVPSKAATSEESGYGKLLAGVQRKNALQREAQERLAASVQQVSQIPVVYNRWSNGELAVYGLFYLVETGFFMAYDADADTFRPASSHLGTQS